MHLHRRFAVLRFAVLRFAGLLFAGSLTACSGSAADRPPADETREHADEIRPQADLPQKLCDLVPQPDAERIMGKSLVEHRNDESGCEYRDARGTGGTGLSIFLNALEVKDQCRLTSNSEPLSGVGDEACIAIGVPVGLYSTVVFRGAGRTFEVVAPGEDKTSQLATAVAKMILAKLDS